MLISSEYFMLFLDLQEVKDATVVLWEIWQDWLKSTRRSTTEDWLSCHALVKELTDRTVDLEMYVEGLVYFMPVDCLLEGRQWVVSGAAPQIPHNDQITIHTQSCWPQVACF